MKKIKQFVERIRVNVSWVWFDLWIGLYIDVKKDIAYICPLPTLVISICLEDIPRCFKCEKRAKKIAYRDSEGWVLFMECLDINCSYDTEDNNIIDWRPFGDIRMNNKELEALGYEVV